MFKSNKGITLIVLVITILIMLILAGISLSGIMGNNNIIELAQEARYKSDVQEVVDLWKSKTANLDVSDLSVDSIEEILAIENIPESLRGKLAIENGEIVFKDGENLTDEEIQWLIESGIFKQFVNRINVNIYAAVKSIVKIQEVVQQSNPFDVIMVLDTSGSMGTSPFRSMLNATNSFMKIIMSANKDNRVGIVSYDDGSETLLNLGSYTTGTASPGNYLYESTSNNYWGWGWGSSSVKFTSNIKEISSQFTIQTGSGTNINSGVDRGMKLLNDSAQKNRKQCMFLLTDGNPSCYNESLDHASPSSIGKYISHSASPVGYDKQGKIAYNTILFLHNIFTVNKDVDLYTFYYNTSNSETSEAVILGKLILDLSKENMKKFELQVDEGPVEEPPKYYAGNTSLADSEFYFEYNSSKKKYIIQQRQGNQFYLYLQNNYTLNTYVSDTYYTDVKSEGNDKFSFNLQVVKKNKTNNYYMYIKDKAFKGTSSSNSRGKFYLYKYDTANPSEEIPGYRRVSNSENLQNQYFLIVYEEDGMYYILNGDTCPNNKNTGGNFNASSSSSSSFKTYRPGFVAAMEARGIDITKYPNYAEGKAYNGASTNEEELYNQFQQVAHTMIINNDSGVQIVEEKYDEVETTKNILMKDDMTVEDRENNKLIHYKIDLNGNLTVRAKVNVFRVSSDVDEDGNIIRTPDPNREYIYSKTYTMQQIINGADPNIVYNGTTILWKITAAFNTSRESFRNLALKDVVNHGEISVDESQNEELDLSNIDFVIPVFVDYEEPLM